MPARKTTKKKKSAGKKTPARKARVKSDFSKDHTGARPSRNNDPEKVDSGERREIAIQRGSARHKFKSSPTGSGESARAAARMVGLTRSGNRARKRSDGKILSSVRSYGKTSRKQDANKRVGKGTTNVLARKRIPKRRKK